MRFRNIAQAMLGVAMGLTLSVAAAQDYPTRAITLNVGYGPGDNMDLLARMLASRAEKILGQPVIVTNKPGAAGAVALASLQKEKPDGYQAAVVLDTPLARLPTLRKLSYKLDDFQPVMQFASGASGVVVKSSSPWKSLPELVQYAKQNPGAVSYTTTGAGTTMDVAFQYIASQAGVQWTHVPYPAAKQGVAAVVGGHVTAAVGASQWMPEVKDGSMRLLAVISERRMPAFPEVPTVRELGYNFVADAGSFIVLPKGTPAPIVQKLEDAFAKAMREPQYVDLVRAIALDVVYRDSSDSRKYLETTQQVFAKTVVDLRIPTEFDGK